MQLPYQLESLPRETKPFYIPATDDEIEHMLGVVGCTSLPDLYQHIPQKMKFTGEIDLPPALEYRELKRHLEDISQKNKNYRHFIGHGLPVYQLPELVPEVLALRGLTTSYTPYQPERSQGTLTSQWIYQCCLAQLTGFEAINASLYDRATAIYEGIACAQRIKKKKRTALVFDSLYAGDKAVLLTMARHTDLHIEFIPAVERPRGRISRDKLQAAIETFFEDAFCVVYPQVNTLGIIEDVDGITDLTQEKGLLALAVIDPMRLGPGGLKPPSDFGRKGADIIVGEGQHLALAPNFGGPGLGIFGIRFNEDNKTDIRATAGRFVGQAVDRAGRPGKVIVLSTREQHIRREKANSNICSNQAYLATLAGAAILARGEAGFRKAATLGPKFLRKALKKLLTLEGVDLAFPAGEVFNEVTLKLSREAGEVLAAAKEAALIPGVDITQEVKGLGQEGSPPVPEPVEGEGSFLSLAFSDCHREEDIETLCDWFSSQFKPKSPPRRHREGEHELSDSFALSPRHLREKSLCLPEIAPAAVRDYYRRLAEQNVSPDDACYPLGSCTMKYNPYINDYAAGLEGFQASHPEAPLSLCQGNLEIIYKTQEYFKAITGLAGVTTQPVAGAQGELVGLKMFQAYHTSKSKGATRDIILIPQSAHGTNPATATVAGFVTSSRVGEEAGIVSIRANQTTGEIDLVDVAEKVEKYRHRIAGIMVTNPNTAGIFETGFKKMADLIHSIDGLVYMDGANMNAIAGWIDLGKLGVDAVHNNTHKTWSIPHGGGGPGDAFVAVSDKLLDFLPGVQVIKKEGQYTCQIPSQSIGSVHRHFGNFAHKVRCYTYLRALGKEGVKKMSAVAVLSARYLYQRLKKHYPVLPAGADASPRMHEFIITLSEDTFAAIEKVGIPKPQIIGRVGKLFLDFGFHAPTVAFPEVYGLMIEPTESYSKKELDRFADAVIEMKRLIDAHPQVLLTAPHFTPLDRVDEVAANKHLVLSQKLESLPEILKDRISQKELLTMDFPQLKAKIVSAHRAKYRAG